MYIGAAQLAERHVAAKVVDAAKDDIDIGRVIDTVQTLDKRIGTVGLDGDARALNAKVFDGRTAQQRAQVRGPGDIVTACAASVIAPRGRIAKAADGRFAQGLRRFHVYTPPRPNGGLRFYQSSPFARATPMAYARTQAACSSSHSISSARCATPKWCPPGQTSCDRPSARPTSS